MVPQDVVTGTAKLVPRVQERLIGWLRPHEVSELENEVHPRLRHRPDKCLHPLQSIRQHVRMDVGDQPEPDPPGLPGQGFTLSQGRNASRCERHPVHEPPSCEPSTAMERSRARFHDLPVSLSQPSSPVEWTEAARDPKSAFCDRPRNRWGEPLRRAAPENDTGLNRLVTTLAPPLRRVVASPLELVSRSGQAGGGPMGEIHLWRSDAAGRRGRQESVVRRA